MKVLMISKASVVGAYQRKLEEIAARGVELSVIVPPYWDDPSGRRALERKHTHGYTMIVAPMRFNGHFHLHYYPALMRHLRAIGPDVLHIDEEPWDFVTFHATRSARTFGSRPLFFSWQNLLRRYPPPFRWFEQYAFRHCAHAIAGNADAIDVLRAKGYRGQLSVIPQFGVDPEIFQPRAQARDVARPFTIAYAGRLVPEKGVDLLLRAAARLTDDWHLRLLGAGPEQASLKALAAQLGIGARVSFEAARPSWQMPDFYAQVDALVLPSRRAPNWVEQFGRVLIEAMACGVPVVGADTGEIPHTIGDAGLIFPADDAAALGARLARLMHDAPLRERLREAGRARVLAHYTQASVAARTVEVYHALCART